MCQISHEDNNQKFYFYPHQSSTIVTELKQALQKIAQLNNDEQISLAKMIGEELEWENTLANMPDKLSLLTKEAIEEYKSGKVKINHR